MDELADEIFVRLISHPCAVFIGKNGVALRAYLYRCPVKNRCNRKAIATNTCLIGSKEKAFTTQK